MQSCKRLKLCGAIVSTIANTHLNSSLKFMLFENLSFYELYLSTNRAV